MGEGDIVRHMKFKSYKNWATVLCAAAVFSLINLRDAQAAPTSTLGILPPPPIDTTPATTTDGAVSLKNPPPPQLDDNLTGGQDLEGTFSGIMMLD